VLYAGASKTELSPFIITMNITLLFRLNGAKYNASHHP
jgi:hypothetical protein